MLRIGKKGLCVFVALLLLCSGAFMVSAATPPEVSERVVETPIEYFMYTNTTTTAFAINSGVATATAALVGYPGTTTRVDIFLYIEQYKNGSWVTVGNFYQHFPTYIGALQGQKSVTKGYSYRARASYYAYSGSSWENIVSYTPSVYYS